MNLSRPLVIALKELRQLRRDRLTMAMMIALPIIQLLLFGYAINNDVRHIPTVIYDQDRSASSRDLAQSLRATGFYDLVGQAESYADVDRALRSSTAKVAVIIPTSFERDLVRHHPTTVRLVLDGSDPQTVASATNTAASLIAARSGRLLIERMAASGLAPYEPIRLEPSTWYNPDLRTAIYIVPGLVGVILTMTMVMLTAMAIARERERGTLEQLIVSPVKSVELIIGKILPFIVIGYLQMTLILLLGRFVFDVPVVGSLPLLYLLSLLFIAANLALGLFFSTLAQTQQQAMQMSFFFILPNILLSGFMFPFEAMPQPAQWIAEALPLTHFLRVVRGIVLRGAGLDDLTQEAWQMAAILGVLVLLASLRFRKKLG
ncbi:MAG: ABC transporter permease [Deltaproteobacteria bacterium]|jgi:ABC-2 type transport system permease protein|nr:ABC transporter permease [Deltaproteobacteria bacterium]